MVLEAHVRRRSSDNDPVLPAAPPKKTGAPGYGHRKRGIDVLRIGNQPLTNGLPDPDNALTVAKIYGGPESLGLGSLVAGQQEFRLGKLSPHALNRAMMPEWRSLTLAELFTGPDVVNPRLRVHARFTPIFIPSRY